MVVAQLQREEVLALTRRHLGLPDSDGSASIADNAYIAAILRHCAGFLCPCSGATLRAATRESLRLLVDEPKLDEHIDEAIESLTVGGDLLELTHATTDDVAVKGTWVFAAPPGYVVRPTGSIFLTGIVADQDTYLPRTLSERILYDDYTRMLVPEADEELVGELAEFGLQKISQETWLKCPRAQLATKFLSDLKLSLRSGRERGNP